ncbi:Transposon Tn3 resolvase [Sporomusa ovata DSM 2662]|uniref:Recombinase n=1 Tax=Sporomusa ovata TaxID=2378 RepID=A0A0U1L5S8_9FIRM|nr:recombinase family protein [Sporomusa ovata]EQB24701.1 resolvase [Sporomusa ovata DSM 2662]CQR75048.1 Recombinase [Sporomusa ovata]
MARSITVIPARANRTSLAENLVPTKKRVAAYCRVSSDQAEQLSSYEAQVTHYTSYINSNPEYELAGIYADQGISGTNTKKREQFNKMIEDCKARKIDMIITKSISRFARNTLDTLTFVRMLKDLGVEVLFEKENIRTLDSKGEVLLSILSSLAQDESRSISENSTWGIRRRFEQGKIQINHVKFLGYDKDEDGNLIINEKQAKIVRRIYTEFLNGKGANRIAKDLELDGVPNWNGKSKWYEGSIRKMLSNEKYKGDALLQKSYTVDFLSKKRVENTGQVPQYLVEDSHPAIIDKEMWEAVQLEMERRKAYALEHGIQKLEYASTDNPFAGKVICGCCGKIFGRKVWNSTDERHRRIIWRCNGKYPAKGKKGCISKHIDDRVLYQAFVGAFNIMVENKDYFMEKWQERLESDNVLVRYKAKQFMGILADSQMMETFDIALYFALVEKITVYDGGRLMVSLLDRTDVECESE